jgi:hypothetical protein
MKAGEYIYKKHIHMFKDKGVEQLICETMHPLHKQYLVKMGFNKSLTKGESDVFVKNITP